MRRRRVVATGLFLAFSCSTLAQGERRLETMQRAPVEGGQLEYEVRGAGEPVLLIHGGVQPILYVVGSESHAMFHEIGKVLRSWFPQSMEDLAVPGVSHGLHQMGGRYSLAVANGIAAFLRRHPIDRANRHRDQ